MNRKLALLIFVLLLAVHQTAQAQMTLVSSFIGGGGSENGTIGQWDDGSMTGGAQPLMGGFWNAQDLPWLRIQRSGGSVLIAWPATFLGFQLEQSSGVGVGAAWESVSQAVIVADGENRITITVGSNARFFRLRKP